MEAAAQVVIDPAQRHFFQRHHCRLPRRLIPRTSGDIEQQIDRRGMGKLGLRTETAVVAVELVHRRLHHLVNDAHAQAASAPGIGFIELNRLQRAAGRLQHLVAARLPCLGHTQQHPRKAGPPIAVIAGKIGSAEERLAVGGEHRGQGPSILPADGGHRGLVAGVHIRPLVPVHLHRDKVLVDHRGQFGILVAFAIHHMAPVAPHRADIQQDRLVLAGGVGKSLGPPLMPPDRLVHGGTKVRRGGVGERVGHCFQSSG